jgi:hypothetical protein
MSVLICTPMYGGQCTSAYFKSALVLKQAFMDGGMDHDWLIGRNESLITRARNSMAATFLQTNYRKMLFIDADIEFTPDDVAKLWNMDEKVSVGIYAMKKPDESWYAVWKDGVLVRDLDGFNHEPVEVDYAGTGFMMIDRSVFEEMDAPEYEAPDPNSEGLRVEKAFFDTGVEDGIYLSEDYWFCKRWREQGGKIMAHPDVRLLHWGSYAYGA